MFETVHHLILHVVFILFTILAFQMVTNGSDSNTKGFPFKFFLMNLAMLLFTMIFPVVYSSGYVYDFKVIPFILAFLYGGKRMGFSMFTAMLLIGLFTTHVMIFLIVNYAIYGVLLIPLSKWYKRLTWKNKILLISVFYFFIPVTRSLYLLQNNEVGQLPLVASSTLIIWITLILTIYLIENRLEQIRIKTELMKAEKFNVVSQLAASVAHEIRNPMTTVRGFMQLLQRETLTKEQKSFISISIQELDHAQDVINQYLSLAKPQTEEYEVFSLTETMNESVDVMSTYAVMNSIEINRNIENDLMIKGIKIEMKQVLLNLLKNAIEAVKENGRITAAATVRKDGRILIVIQDNGAGISPEQLKVLGRPYYSTKEKGTGLGLTFCYQIVKGLKGEIEVESERGVGTTFRIFLPGNP
ncbi:ATP-binding protein [Rossellomorea aquimaris]|uniref:histidine kinase n=1 Tax=Rossellomorea aquimaris TaxID=189382 RepID=A0A5D4UMA1_9BACI|nr:ATP-binding protein [Rossellomorea aquimaris]TYS81802.1 GHKL domain-containing protein [Rossellomorea aquimaris]TYS88426.1 GHKL domain-containing protein [Rossellomorea aquimaris]